MRGCARRQKRWWKRGVVETKMNTVHMPAWVHKECNIMDELALIRLQRAWETPEQKDECIVRMNVFFAAYGSPDLRDDSSLLSTRFLFR